MQDPGYQNAVAAAAAAQDDANDMSIEEAALTTFEGGDISALTPEKIDETVENFRYGLALAAMLLPKNDREVVAWMHDNNFTFDQVMEMLNFSVDQKDMAECYMKDIEILTARLFVVVARLATADPDQPRLPLGGA